MGEQGGDVWVIGIGARTPVGLSSAQTAAAVRAGIVMMNEHPFMVDRSGEPFVVSRLVDPPVEITGAERLARLATPAAKEALAVADLQAEGPVRSLSAAFVLGLPEERPGFPPSAATQVANRLRSVLGSAGIREVDTLSHGHSAGLMAIEEACRKIEAGRADLCLAGGVDSYLEPETLEWLDDEELLHSTENPYGFVPGEAAGFCLLAGRRAVEALSSPRLAGIAAVVTEMEPIPRKAEGVCTGEGLSAALRKVLHACPPEVPVDEIICDLNGDRYRADEFAFALARISDRVRDPGGFLAPATSWGDVGAASGPLFVTLAAIAARKGYSSGPRTLVWTSSEAGERSAALLETPMNRV